MTNSQFKLRIIAARAGDVEALSDVLASFRNYLRLLARLHVTPLMQAKFDESDIVQETCAQAALSIGTFSGEDEAAFAGWLRQVLANKGAALARQYRGTYQRDVTLERRLQDQFDRSSVNLAQIIPSPVDSPSQQSIRQENAVALADALTRVSAEQREVLIRHGLEGMAMPEVATKMGCSESAAWKLWARGLQAMRRQFRDTL